MPKLKRAEQIIILPVEEEDIEELSRLETQIFSSFWNKEQLKNEMEKKAYFIKAIKEKTKNIIGFLIAQLIFPEAELLRIGVQTEEQRKGIASSLHDNLIRDLSANNYQSIFLEVRASDRPAINFYLKNGYKLVARRKDYYFHSCEDALILKRELFFINPNSSGINR